MFQPKRFAEQMSYFSRGCFTAFEKTDQGIRVEHVAAHAAAGRSHLPALSFPTALAFALLERCFKYGRLARPRFEKALDFVQDAFGERHQNQPASVFRPSGSGALL